MRKAKIVQQRRLKKIKSNGVSKWLARLHEKRKEMESIRKAFEFRRDSEKLFAKVVFGQMRTVLRKEQRVLEKFTK